MIKGLIKDINTLCVDYYQYMDMVKSGSIMHGVFASDGFGEIQKEYRGKRKILRNHVQLFV